MPLQRLLSSHIFGALKACPSHLPYYPKEHLFLQTPVRVQISSLLPQRAEAKINELHLVLVAALVHDVLHLDVAVDNALCYQYHSNMWLALLKTRKHVIMTFIC